MRVLHFFKTALPDTMGGVEQGIDQIARGTTKLGITCNVLSLSRAPNPEAFAFIGYRRYCASRNFELASTGFSYSAFGLYRRLASQSDLIHYHFPWPFMDLVHFAAGVGKPAVVTYHSDIVRQTLLLPLYRPLMNRFLADVDRVVATSANYLKTSDVLKGIERKVSIIPLGIDEHSRIAPSSGTIAYWRNLLGPRFFLFVGVLRYYKGLHILLEAMQGAPFPAVIVGSGPIESTLKTQARRLRLDNVHFLGFLPEADKAALLELSYAIVFPSHLRSEAFGISLLEGAMYGKPMISSEIGTGTTFINVDGVTGLVVPRGDAGALRRAMEHLWARPEEASSMGELAYARYRKLFTSEKMSRSYVNIYDELLSGARVRSHVTASGAAL